ncbi:Protein of unknown function [Cotesia congregata]|uniref:Uncharacterized protein n=1 Tax=Cotesia congregata TaxID=51543 RepID=A0A8J2HMY5_COTCN|nr:Protein of unknown function [Cotesia congregata]
MEATKALLRHSLRKKLDAALESESYLLIQHWCSIECQEAIKLYLDEKFMPRGRASFPTSASR